MQPSVRKQINGAPVFSGMGCFCLTLLETCSGPCTELCCCSFDAESRGRPWPFATDVVRQPSAHALCADPALKAALCCLAAEGSRCVDQGSSGQGRAGSMHAAREHRLALLDELAALVVRASDMD